MIAITYALSEKEVWDYYEACGSIDKVLAKFSTKG